MIILKQIYKYSLMYLFFYNIYKGLCGSGLSESESSSDESQTGPKEPVDPFKTTFEGDLINLDINCRHGYDNKFSCIIENIKVTYQCNCLFKKVSDGELKIWEATNKNAFRVIVHFIDRVPFTASIELERGNENLNSYYLKKYNSNEWDKSDVNNHNKRVENYLKALGDHKQKVKDQNEKAIDLCFVLKNDSCTFEVHEYKSGQTPVSSSTPEAKSKGHQIDSKEYTVTDMIKKANSQTGKTQSGKTSESDGKTTEQEDCDTDTYGVQNPQKHLVVEMKETYRIVKIRYDQGITKATIDVWETGGSYFVYKMIALGDSEKYTKVILYILDSDSSSAKKFKYVYDFKKNDLFYKNEFELKEEKTLPTIDFKY